MELEPSSEPPAATGNIAAVRAAAEAALPAIVALLNDPSQLPQQALGALNFLADVINRVLISLEDPENLAKFRRLKRSALRKKLAKAPEKSEAVLRAAGFREERSQGDEYFEWGDEDEALAPAIAVLTLISRLQEKVQASGLKSLSEPLDANVGAAEILNLSYGNVLLLERRERAVGGSGTTTQTASTVSGSLVKRAWLQDRLPKLTDAMEEFHNLFEPGAREKALSKAIVRCMIEVRASQCTPEAARLTTSNVLMEVAQLAASAALVNLRRPDILYLKASLVEAVITEAEPDCEPGVQETLTSEIQRTAEEPSRDNATTSVLAQVPLTVLGRSPFLAPPPTGAGSAGHVVPTILDCVPALRLGLPHATMTELVGMRESPSFFTSGLYEKEFEVSLRALADHIVAQWLKRPALAAALLRPETSVVGTGCALNLGNDDKAIIMAVIA